VKKALLFSLFKIKAWVPGRRFLAYFFGAVAKEVSRQKGEIAQVILSCKGTGKCRRLLVGFVLLTNDEGLTTNDFFTTVDPLRLIPPYR